VQRGQAGQCGADADGACGRSVENIIKNVSDNHRADGDKYQVGAGNAPFIARIPGQASEQGAEVIFLAIPGGRGDQPRGLARGVSTVPSACFAA
ncbi:hypothetical protein, partial [Pusillimonas noertemannii]|uniref:hypothetical protein n=1 Tax=Pusillimonas noertemannii TaxID=305977 RepID=UPI003340E2F0